MEDFLNKKSVVLLTGSELRHDFFRIFVANSPVVEVLATYCESKKGNLQGIVNADDNGNSLRKLHLSSRAVTERDFFGLYCEAVFDRSNPIRIEKGKINDPEHVQKIISLNPDMVVAYGCSIIRSELLEHFKGRFVNIHLGLSPYYRGAGTNFWPFVNRNLQFVGVTFMHIDKGIDTGAIIHQIRAHINHGDNIHQIGNRLIRDACIECVKIISGFDELHIVPQQIIPSFDGYYYRKRDFTEEAIEVAYKNMNDGLISEYLSNKDRLDEEFPIVANPKLKEL